MSRIFEALQHAEEERLQRNKSAEEQRSFQGRISDRTRIGTADPHRCLEYAARVGREGLTDFVYRLVGMYPWQCTRCFRCFHRFHRKP